MTKKVGLIGAGAIGTVLAEAIEHKLVPCDELVVFDLNNAKSEKLKATVKFPVKVASNIDELLSTNPVVVVEAAGQGAVREYYTKLTTSSAELIFMSTGALLELQLTPKVHFPAGAIGGLDAISAAANAGINEVTLTTRKNPKALNKTNTQEAIIYEGTAEEAAKLFPREMNVAATLALTVKPAKVQVRVVSDPKITRNTHEITVKWNYGEMQLKFANQPHPDNPHTSALAAWATIRLLQNLLKAVETDK